MADYMESSSDEEIILLALAHHLNEKCRKRKKLKKRWVRPRLEKGLQQGAYHALLQELTTEDVESHNNFVRMDLHHFEQLLAVVGPYLQKQNTNMRESISPSERLAVTLRFLATGDSYKSLSFLYRIGRTTLGEIIPETCQALVTALKDKYLKVPCTTEEWEVTAATFADKWNFPNCIGAVDGKYVAIKAPPNSGSVYYNYQEFHSIVLMAVVDALFRFHWYELGANGRDNDAGVSSCSSLVNAMEDNTLNIPAPRELPNAKRPFKVPFLVIADEAFPLKNHIMKPYPKRGLDDRQRIFNYHLSMARRVSEGAFSILVNRFRVLAHTMHLQPETAMKVTESCLALHNFLRTEKDNKYATEVTDRVQKWFRDDCAERARFYYGNHNPVLARQVRDELKDHFWNVGQEGWQ